MFLPHAYMIHCPECMHIKALKDCGKYNHAKTHQKSKRSKQRKRKRTLSSLLNSTSLRSLGRPCINYPLEKGTTGKKRGFAMYAPPLSQTSYSNSCKIRNHFK